MLLLFPETGVDDGVNPSVLDGKALEVTPTAFTH